MKTLEELEKELRHRKQYFERCDNQQSEQGSVKLPQSDNLKSKSGNSVSVAEFRFSDWGNNA